MKVSRFLLLLFTITIVRLQAQELPPAHHYTPDVYQGGSQNWEVDQGDDKHIYVANNNGLLIYNGADWTLYETPNRTIMRSVSVIEDKIYTGSYMEFGVWERDFSGTLTYTSLSENISENLIEDEEFWEILEFEKYIAFQSLKQIYLFDPIEQSFEIIPCDDALVRMFNIHGELYFQQENLGIFKFQDNSIEPVILDPVVKFDEVIQMIPRENQILVITRNNGIYSWDEKSFRRIELQDINLSGQSIYSALALKNGEIVIGTISNGLYHLAEDLSLIYQMDQSSSLGNNTVLSLFEDEERNIWTGLDNGITCINNNSSIRVFSDESGRLGTVYASAILDGRLYIGTNQGLFVRPMDAESAFLFVPGTDGQVWNLKIVGGILLCSHHKGTFEVRGTSARLIPNTKGTWKITPLDSKNNLLLQGTYDGLYILEKVNENWKLRNRIEGFDNSARHFEFSDNRIFVNHEYKGLFILTVDNNFRKALRVQTQSDLKSPNSALANFQGDIIYVSAEGFYAYNDSSKQFYRSEKFSQLLPKEEYISGRLPLTSDQDAFWIFKKSGMTLVRSLRGDSIQTHSIPLSLGTRNDMEEYENILQVDSSIFLLGRANGYMLIDLENFEINPFEIQLLASDMARTAEAFQPILPERKDFHYEECNFRFKFSAPVYHNLFRQTYETRLVGIYNNWSKVSGTSILQYDNLPPGKYEFQARALIGEQHSKNIISYSFRIKKPWYATRWMIAIYIMTFAIFALLLHRVYRSYYKRQQTQLIQQNLQQWEYERMKNEQEIIKLKNAQLESNYEAKSKELATSLMNIVNKNELLNQIKEQLLRLKDQEGLSSVIKTIDLNLNQKKNWEMFKEAFDNADSEFFKNLKEKHPKLSPNDLKLCAYLRLNLSSKEIAPLINISPRSVEIKRYRLRKKLNLDGNENLVNYIMEI